jgi:hypothetical protein
MISSLWPTASLVLSGEKTMAVTIYTLDPCNAPTYTYHSEAKILHQLKFCILTAEGEMTGTLILSLHSSIGTLGSAGFVENLSLSSPFSSNKCTILWSVTAASLRLHNNNPKLY